MNDDTHATWRALNEPPLPLTRPDAAAADRAGDPIVALLEEILDRLEMHSAKFDEAIAALGRIARMMQMMRSGPIP